LAATYLAGAVDADGRFVYRINLNPDIEPAKAYNILRHAGAMYAMAQYQARYPTAPVRAALLRAAAFLQREHIAPLPKRPKVSAAWSEPIDQGLREAKLGGAGLALVALSAAHELEPGSTKLERLRSLARFVAYMQRPSGRYFSKFIPAEGGRWEQWTSLYYPGEAALGMVMLYEHDPQLKWLRTAARSLGYLATKRRRQRRVPADHWALLAPRKLLERFDDLGPEPVVSRAQLIEHALQICQQILDEQDRSGHAPDSPLRGSPDPAGRTTPTATRVEGLTAALAFLPETQQPLRERLRMVVDEAALFLMRTQVTSGRYAGAIPRAAQQLKDEKPDSSFNRRATEVRIDYVQHALSAWLAVAKLKPQAQPGEAATR